jgi:phage-related minor tail protein
MKRPSATTLATLACLAVVLVDGFARGYMAPGKAPGALMVATTLLVNFTVFAWYRADSDRLAFRRSSLLSMAVTGLTVFALPYYLVRTRGGRNGLIAMAALFAGFVATLAADLAGIVIGVLLGHGRS